MEFVSGLAKGIYVGQTHIQHPQALKSANQHLSGFNLALHVGDHPQRVQQHRMQLLQDLSAYGVHKLSWMTQTHSTIVHQVGQLQQFDALIGDGLLTTETGHALMIMTADCLPVVLGNAEGTEIANLHAGWRGLADGMIENMLEKMQFPVTWAWLGAAISQPCFEVGAEVKARFCEKYPELASAFITSTQPGKFQADLYAIARYILSLNGVPLILGGTQCSFTQDQDFYSYRRDPLNGRMATFAFIA